MLPSALSLRPLSVGSDARVLTPTKREHPTMEEIIAYRGFIEPWVDMRSSALVHAQPTGFT
jgi:hypothetical protein